MGVMTEKSYKTSSSGSLFTNTIDISSDVSFPFAFSGKEFLIAKLSNFSSEFAKLAEISLFLFDQDKDLLEKDGCGLILGVISPKITQNSKGYLFNYSPFRLLMPSAASR